MDTTPSMLPPPGDGESGVGTEKASLEIGTGSGSVSMETESAPCLKGDDQGVEEATPSPQTGVSLTNVNNNGDPDSNNSLSKRQKRKQEKIRQWEETRHLRKEKRKQKKKEFYEKKRQRLEILKSEAEQKGLESSTIVDYHHLSRKKLKQNLMKNSSCKVGICVDLSFNHLMIEKDVHKCIKQLSRCYSINRRYENPLQFHISSFGGKSEEVIRKNNGWKNWDVHFHEKSYMELEEYPKDKIVYLTSESENILTETDDSKLYVIGGLVDHNSLKGLCHKLALEKGIQHARLPLDDYIEMSCRRVLNIVHVFEILGGVAHKRPWADVLMEVIPQRNQAKLKEHESESEDELNTNNEEDGNCDSKINEIKINETPSSSMQEPVSHPEQLSKT